MRTLIERFENKYIPEPNSGCFIWLGALSNVGYGRISYYGKNRLAHRVAWIITNGDPQEFFVCHRCDNPLCVNVDHLFLGTHQENMDDMRNKKRMKMPPHPCGVNHHFAVLTPKDILDIRLDNRLQKEISKSYNISQSVISNIKTGKTWRHI
jgi:hypothetical protein